MDLNRRLPRVDSTRFAMVPRPDIPRSTFVTTHSHKTTFHAGYLIPILVDEVLPGDVHQGQVTIFARLANLLFPLMDNVELETFFFFVPNPILWTNWKKFMGERANPSDSISYTVPEAAVQNGTLSAGTIYDYMGLPIGVDWGGDAGRRVNALPFRAYVKIWNDWFRDQNLQNSLTEQTGDGPEAHSTYSLQKTQQET